jgi:hypothetical protein
MNFSQEHQLRNIKRTTSGFQVQFIQDGKSHSAFTKDLEEAKEIRDKMEKELGIIAEGAYRVKPLKNKTSTIPGTKEPMPAGVSLRIRNRNGVDVYEVRTAWYDINKTPKTKCFHACNEVNYSVSKMKVAYERALRFRKAWEEAVEEGSLAFFDPTEFNLN